ncbi:polyphosphate--glucose phosphotransferase [Corynebacterium aquilae]|uniref:Polyphosphate glucokinase n=1 Tax=Corynebacterium aquilae DSM 44791 TaxID=1431546 RepID=A0A1L7CGA4_9CORY|nr:ROK family protein [Corynebacterium aquilae]APT84892.1 polyphosphate glucokinase [Corynebacterium aquilae DSM 44791]
MSNLGFGIDIGGSGIKGAVVDLDSGDFVSERIKILTPKPATPQAVAAVVAEIVSQAQWEGPVGITVPSVVIDQIALTAANIDSSWVGVDCAELFGRVLGREVYVLNDADAAGIAEVAYGDEQARSGATILLTFGTGIGSALMVNGVLYPNSELGHMIIDGQEAEAFASSAAKDREELRYKEWAKRVDKVLHELERLLNPQAFIVGGGISRKAEKWVPRLTVKAPVYPARLRNRAGIVGAAWAAAHGVRP